MRRITKNEGINYKQKNLDILIKEFNVNFNNMPIDDFSVLELS